MKSKNRTKNGLGKICPECGELSLIQSNIKQKREGVEYNKKIWECKECGFIKDYHISPKRYKEVFNPHW